MVHEEARVKLKPCAGHQRRLVLIDWRVTRLTGKDSWALEPIFPILMPGEKHWDKVCFSTFVA